jgi:DNA polymerase I-like protein with 3'-5' exonuclease and polymerase domains
VPEGYKLVGIDASGLELRMLAHYMADKEYINEIINGDIHTTNQKFAGLKSRDEAKTFIYALIYGAGDEKIGKIISGNKQTGRKLRERFLSSLPALKSLKQRVERAAKKDYLKGLDGRKIYVRHRHASLNTLLQGGGAIVMKKAMCILQDLINLNTFDAKFVANIHDEWQLQVKESQADCVGRLGVSSIRNAGLHFNMRCPLTGEYKIGGNWSETH